MLEVDFLEGGRGVGGIQTVDEEVGEVAGEVLLV